MSTTDLQDVIREWSAAGVDVDVMHLSLTRCGLTTEGATNLIALTLH